jgi:HlyD family secretion protein
MYKRLRNWMLLGLVAIIAAGAVRFAGAGPASLRPQGAIIDSSKIERGDIQITVSASGPIQPLKQVSLAFSAVGNVTALNVQEGDHVLKGQTLAVLDQQTAVDALTLAQARLYAAQMGLQRLTDKPRQVDINVAQAALNLAKAREKASHGGADPLQVQINAANVENAKNALWAAQLTRDANNKKKTDLQANPITAPQANLLPSDQQNNANLTNMDYGVQIAQAQLNAAQSQRGNDGSMASAQAQVTAAQNNLDKLLRGADKNDIARTEANVKSAQTAVDQAKANLDKTELVAPFDGVIGKLNLNLGQPASNPALIILDTNRFYVDLPVDEIDIAKVTVGQKAILKFDALTGVILDGKVTRVAQTATRTGETVTYTVRVEIEAAGNPLISTMSATANIVTGQSTNVLRVRNRFIRLDRATGRYYATIRQADGKTTTEVEVKLGLRNDTFSEVVSGLKEGDEVVNVEQTGFPTPNPNAPNNPNRQ